MTTPKQASIFHKKKRYHKKSDTRTTTNLSNKFWGTGHILNPAPARSHENKFSPTKFFKNAVKK